MVSCRGGTIVFLTRTSKGFPQSHPLMPTVSSHKLNSPMTLNHRAPLDAEGTCCRISCVILPARAAAERRTVSSPRRLVLLLLVLCAVSCRRQGSSGLPPAVRESATRAQVATFTSALGSFELDCGRLPTTAEGLTGLITRPPDIPDTRWHGPYTEAIPKDAWGHALVSRCPGLHNTNGFDIYSCGRDGVSESGGEDDDGLASWSIPRAR